MKGIELSKKFYNEFGKSMLKEFDELLPFLAVGLCGSGSECNGFDDEVSHDHDFEPGFCIFIPSGKIDEKAEFQLERAYAKLPNEFLGFKRSRLSPVGGNRHGVIKIEDFFKAKTGNEKGCLSLYDWFSLPEHSLLEATNGEIFFDNYGEVSKIRENLKYFPEDIRLKKLAGNLLLLGQSGQYNYNRCIIRNDTAAAQLSVIEFVKSTISVIFLLNKKYLPYYKWQFKALAELKILGDLSSSLEFLISSENDQKTSATKQEIIEIICQKVADELKLQCLVSNTSAEMESLAYIVNDNITDNKIRNMHVLSAV